MHVETLHAKALCADRESTHALRFEAPRARTTDTRVRSARGPWLQIVSQTLQLAGPRAEFLRHSEKPWSSATFSGARHTIALAFTGSDAIADGEELIAALPDHEFAIPGHLVADASLRGIEHEAATGPHLAMEIEILLLRDL